MKPSTVYVIGALAFIVCLAIGIYYLIPMGTAHLFSSHGANYVDVKHAVVFFALAVVALIAARFVANSRARG